MSATNLAQAAEKTDKKRYYLESLIPSLGGLHMESTKAPQVDFYLPPEGLQGQQIPCHVVWPPFEWTAIEIEFPDILEVASYFNTKPGYVTTEPGKLSVLALERDGYLGLVFRTKRVSDLKVTTEVRLTVKLRAETLQTESRTIELFRPNLEIKAAPRSIVIDAKGDASDKLELRHRGYGTLLVAVDAAEESEVKITVPDDLIKAFGEFARYLGERIDQLETKYPQYKTFFGLSKSLDYSKREEAIAKLSDAGFEALSDKDFLEDFANAFISAILKSTDFELLVVRPIVDFIKSAIGRGIIFTTPFLEIQCDETPRKLVLEVKCSDALGVDVLKFKTPVLTVAAKPSQRVSIGSILRWSSEVARVA